MSQTTDYYDGAVDDYVAMVGSNCPKGLVWLMAQLPKGARVLDLGCGPGHHATHLAKGGMDVLAIDASSEMVARAGQVDGVEARHASFDDIPSLGPLDGAWASFSLLHATRADVPRHIADLAQLCRSGAPFVWTMKTGTGEQTDHLGRFYSFFTEEEMRSILAEAGFDVIDAATGVEKGMAGTLDPWCELRALRA